MWTFLEMDIGLEPGALIEMDLRNERPINNTFIMVLTHDHWLAWRHLEQPPLTGSGGENGGTSLNSFMVSHWRSFFYDSLQVSFRVTAPTKDRYHVGILNAQQQAFRLTGTLTMVNPGGRQLPLQDEDVPPILLWTSGLFFVSCLVFALVLAVASTRRSRTTMHLVMGATLFLKGCVLFLWWFDYLQVAKMGYSSGGAQVTWQLLEKVQSILELMMFLLIALGWKFIRPSLNQTEVRFAVGISVISFYLGVFEVACTTASTCSGYQLSRYILHSLCYLVVIVAMNFNLQMVYASIAEAPASLDSGKFYKKHQAYKVFRWIFLAFIIAPTVELFLKVTVMPWDAVWLFVLLQQLRTWAIYVSIAAAFAFLPHPPPLRVFELTRDAGVSDDEAGGEAGGPVPDNLGE